MNGSREMGCSVPKLSKHANLQHLAKYGIIGIAEAYRGEGRSVLEAASHKIGLWAKRPLLSGHTSFAVRLSNGGELSKGRFAMIHEERRCEGWLYFPGDADDDAILDRASQRYLVPKEEIVIKVVLGGYKEASIPGLAKPATNTRRVKAKTISLPLLDESGYKPLKTNYRYSDLRRKQPPPSRPQYPRAKEKREEKKTARRERETGWMPKWRKMRGRLIQKRGHVCEVCSYRLVIECDHIIPKSEGGDHTESNALLLCSNCHHLKTWLWAKWNDWEDGDPPTTREETIETLRAYIDYLEVPAGAVYTQVTTGAP